MPFPISVAILAAATLGAGPLSAEGGPVPEEGAEAILRLMNIPTITASRIQQTSRLTPAKVVVITAEEIRQRGYQDLEETLHDLAGFDFEKGMGVHWSQIYMRGERSANSDRFIFLWDGVVQNDIWAQVTWFERQFPLTNIERIEIMYGPASLLYGSNAMSGIINVITKKESRAQGIQVDLRQGSFATRMVEINGAHTMGDWRFMMNARGLRSQERDLSDEYWTDRNGRRRYYGLRADYLDFASLAANSSVDRAGRSHSEFEGDPQSGIGQLWVQKNGLWEPFSGRFGRESKHWFVEAGAGYRGWNLRVGSWYKENSEDAWTTPQSLLGASWNAGASFLSLTHDGRLGELWSSHVQVLARTTSLEPSTEEPDFARTIPWDPNENAPLPKVKAFGPFIDYKLFNREYRASAHLDFRQSDTSAVLGAEFVAATVFENYYTRIRDDQPWSDKPQHAERNLAVFGNGQWNLGECWSLAGGLRLDHNWEAGGSGGFGNLLTSRVAAIYLPNSANTLKLIYGEAYQAPQPFKKYSTNPSRPLASPNLLPEKLNSFEFLYEFFPVFNSKNSLSLYRNRVSNKIDLVSIPEGNRFVNRGSLLIRGGEFESRYFMDSDNSIFLNLTANSAQDDATGRDTGGIAPFQGNLGTDLLFRERLGVSFRIHYVAARKTAAWDSTSYLTAETVDPYLTCDLALHWRNLLPGFDLRLSLYNLTNVHYYDPGPRSADGQYYNGAILQQPFRGTLGVSYRF